jgi:hypothetical protein
MGHAFDALPGEWIASGANAVTDGPWPRHLPKRRANPAGTTDGQGCANTRDWKLKIMNISFAVKSRSRTWIGSVQGAVATWSVISIQFFNDFDSHGLPGRYRSLY